MTFKEILKNKVKEKYPGYLSYNELKDLCRLHNHREDTGRRLLEKDMNPNIEKEFDGSYVKGWKWKKKKRINTVAEYYQNKMTIPVSNTTVSLDKAIKEKNEWKIEQYLRVLNDLT